MLTADCPGCKKKISIMAEDDWSHCPFCDMFVRVDTSLSSSPRIEAGILDGDQIVRNIGLTRGYATRAASPSTAPQPPRVIRVTDLSDYDPPRQPARPRNGSGSTPPVYTTSKTSTGTGGKPARSVAPNLGQLNSLAQVQAELRRVDAELADLDARVQAQVTEMNRHYGNPARILELSEQLNSESAQRAELAHLKNNLLAREDALAEEAAEAKEAAARQRSIDGPTGEAQRALFGFLVAFFVVALGVFGWQTGLHWDLNTIGMAALIAFIGGILSWLTAYITYSLS